MADPPGKPGSPRQPAGRSSGRGQVVVAVIGLAVLALGVLGVRLAPGAGGWPDVVYRSLQLFVLDGGALDGLTTPLNPVLQVARFLAPAVTVLAIILAVSSLFADTVRRLWATLRRGHAVVCGDSDESWILAANLRHEGRRVVVVSRGGDRAPRGVPVVVGDARNPRTLRTAGAARAADVFTFAERDADYEFRGVAVTTAVALTAGRIERGRRAPQLTTYAEVTSNDLGEALWLRASASPGVAPIDFFSLTDVAARVLLRTWPVGRTTAAVVASGDLGQAVRRSLSRSRTVPQHHQMPDATTLDEWRSLGVDQIYVCLEREQEAITAALRLAAGDPPWRIVVCLPRREPFAEALGEGGRVSVFGILDEACRLDTIAEASLTNRLAKVTEQLARAIHHRYLESAARSPATGTRTGPAAVPWDDLPEALRESNREQARTIGYYLSEIGARIAFEPARTAFRFTPAEIGLLSKREHQRWMQERLAAGIRWGPERTDTEHPDLVEWSELSPDARRKDTDAIMRMPDLLDAEGLYLRRDDDQ